MSVFSVIHRMLLNPTLPLTDSEVRRLYVKECAPAEQLQAGMNVEWAEIYKEVTGDE